MFNSSAAYLEEQGLKEKIYFSFSQRKLSYLVTSALNLMPVIKVQKNSGSLQFLNLESTIYSRKPHHDFAGSYSVYNCHFDSNTMTHANDNNSWQ
jgi:hypothetical protein